MKRIVLFIILALIPCAVLAGPEEAAFTLNRESMVKQQIQARGITDTRVLQAIRTVKRHLFVPEELQRLAYADRPLPIGYQQTISQPYIVAFMTQAAGLMPDDRVLEIGTGSGYQAAVLAELVYEVYTIEILQPLAESSRSLLKDLGYKNIKVKHGDGYKGWKEYAPFDAIIVTAAPPEIPEELVDQLRIGGRMIAPVGRHYQELYLITKTETGFIKEPLLPVAFVPMIHADKDE
jgi:protein-L-isoaspartate(D-aspartate) O-methyltransferase